jgi:hypothetical protein
MSMLGDGGCREFVKDLLPGFKEANPQLDIKVAVRRGYHPNIDARYGEEPQRPGSSKLFCDLE